MCSCRYLHCRRLELLYGKLQASVCLGMLGITITHLSGQRIHALEQACFIETLRTEILMYAGLGKSTMLYGADG